MFDKACTFSKRHISHASKEGSIWKFREKERGDQETTCRQSCTSFWNMSGDSGQSVHIRRSRLDFGIMILRMLEGEEGMHVFFVFFLGNGQKHTYRPTKTILEISRRMMWIQEGRERRE
jgi:hypothetical protein